LVLVFSFLLIFACLLCLILSMNQGQSDNNHRYS
jgi:hypothetical protein